MSDIRYLHDARCVIDTMQRMYEEGTLRDLIVYFPSAKDPNVWHSTATDNIKLSDVLMAKHWLGAMERKLETPVE